MVPVGVPLGDPACIQWTCAWKLSRKREWVQTHPIFGPRFGRPTRLSGSRGSATAASHVSLTPVAPRCRLQSAARSFVNSAVLRTKAHIKLRTVARALGVWWQAPVNHPRLPARWACSCLRAASHLVGREKSHFQQAGWLGSEPVPRSIHWPFHAAISLLSSRRMAWE